MQLFFTRAPLIIEQLFQIASRRSFASEPRIIMDIALSQKGIIDTAEYQSQNALSVLKRPKPREAHAKHLEAFLGLIIDCALASILRLWRRAGAMAKGLHMPSNTDKDQFQNSEQAPGNHCEVQTKLSIHIDSIDRGVACAAPDSPGPKEKVLNLNHQFGTPARSFPVAPPAPWAYEPLDLWERVLPPHMACLHGI